MSKKAVLILFLFLRCFTGNAQQYFFSGYSISDGLSQSVVNCIFNDSKGYIWFGTQNGLNKYNGYTFEVFTYAPNDSNTISNNWINGIAEDKEANLWIATKGGLVKYSRKEKRFSRIDYRPPYKALVTECIYDVKCARNGNIIVNMPPVLSFCDPKTLKFNHFISPFDLWLIVNKFEIPTIFISQTPLLQSSYETNGFIAYGEEENKFFPIL
jgi:hypothetical protein